MARTKQARSRENVALLIHAAIGMRKEYNDLNEMKDACEKSSKSFKVLNSAALTAYEKMSKLELKASSWVIEVLGTDMESISTIFQSNIESFPSDPSMKLKMSVEELLTIE